MMLPSVSRDLLPRTPGIVGVSLFLLFSLLIAEAPAQSVPVTPPIGSEFSGTAKGGSTNRGSGMVGNWVPQPAPIDSTGQSRGTVTLRGTNRENIPAPSSVSPLPDGTQSPVAEETQEPTLAEQRREAVEQRFQRQQQADAQAAQRKASEEARRPTEWQLQNPSGRRNHFPTARYPNGNIAPNDYFGPQFREWNQMSPPLFEKQLPSNMTAVPPLPQTNVMVAPLSYWGTANQRWNQVSPGQANPDPRGGWNFRSGW